METGAKRHENVVLRSGEPCQYLLEVKQRCCDYQEVMGTEYRQYVRKCQKKIGQGESFLPALFFCSELEGIFQVGKHHIRFVGLIRIGTGQVVHIDKGACSAGAGKSIPVIIQCGIVVPITLMCKA